MTMMSSPPELKNSSVKSHEEQKFIIKERDHRAISFWWQTFQILFYFLGFIGGICTSIALGNISTAFEPFCILHANLTVTGIYDIAPVQDFRGEEVYQIYTQSVSVQDVLVNEWGNANGCLFCTFSPAAQAVFAFLWGALFLQCGKGGINSQKLMQTWKIVAPALFFTSGLFIVSIVSLSMITTGLSGFCNNILENSVSYDLNLTSCGDVFSLRFPWDQSGSTNLYTNYVLARVGSIVVFMGYLLALLLLLFRCVAHVDFVILERKIIPRPPENEVRPSTSRSYENSGTMLRSNSDSSSDDLEDEDMGVKNKYYEDESRHKKSDTTTVPLINQTDSRILDKKVK